MCCGDVVYTVTSIICTDVNSLFSFVILKIGGNVAARSYFVYLTIIFYIEVSQYFTDLANIRLLVKDAISVLFVLTIVGERRVFLTFN